MVLTNSFSSVWVVVFADTKRHGEPVRPLALAAMETRGGRLVEIGMPKLGGVRNVPFPTGPQCLVVTVEAEVVVGCMLALGWRLPDRLVDLLVEFASMTNGSSASSVGGLAGALLAFGLPSAGALVTGTAPDQVRARLGAITKLYSAMAAQLDLGRALLRGRYLVAVARMEATGIPVDRTTIERFQANWPALRRRVIDIADQDLGVFRDGRFSVPNLIRWLALQRITWPTLVDGRLDLGDDAFNDMARAHEGVRAIKDLRNLGDVDPCALNVGADSRNRTPLRPFATSTGRNAPSAKASVLGTAAWLRHLIRPEPGRGIALIDWHQQEYGIAAALSGDVAMKSAYTSGDPYLALAIGASGAPPDATAESHPHIRERYKTCALGVQYGMGAARLGKLLGLPESEADLLLRAHRTAFTRYWDWREAIESHALLHGNLQSVFGWRIAVGPFANLRSLCNFPLQANGAEMLRLACCLCTEAGITVCAPNHDALLIEAPLDVLDDTIATARKLMAEASDIVLDGFPLRTSVKVVRAPERWSDPRGRAVWAAIEEALAAGVPPVRQRNASCSPAHPRPIYYCLSKKDGSHASD